MKSNFMTIREVATRLNIAESTIRGYCRRGLVKPKRDKTRNWRWFTEEDVQAIKTLIQPR